MEKRSDSEEGADGPRKPQEDQERCTAGDNANDAPPGGRERKPSKTSTDRESDREREQAGGREKRLSSSTPTLGVQHSLDCDFGDKLHTAKVRLKIYY